MRKFHKIIPFVLIALFFVGCADIAKRDLASDEPFDEVYEKSRTLYFPAHGYEAAVLIHRALKGSCVDLMSGFVQAH